MILTSMLGDLARFHTDALITRLTQYCTLAQHAIDPVLRVTGQLSADEVLAEMSRRNEAIIAHREAGAKVLVAEAIAIVTRRIS